MITIKILKNYTRPILDKELFHIRCVYYKIYLCVQDGFGVGKSVHKFRKTIVFINV